MTEIINNRVKVDFEWIYADFRSEIGVLIEHPEVFKISIEGGETLNCSNLRYADVKRFVNNKSKNGMHIIVHTNGLTDDDEATIICCDSKGDALKDTVWKYINLQNRMGRMPKIAIGDTVEFDGGYPKGNAVRIHNYGDTFFIDFEI